MNCAPRRGGGGVWRLSADLLVWSKASFITLKPSAVSSQALTSAALQAEASLTTGPRVIPSESTLLLHPPLSCTQDGRSGEQVSMVRTEEDRPTGITRVGLSIHPGIIWWVRVRLFIQMALPTF